MAAAQRAQTLASLPSLAPLTNGLTIRTPAGASIFVDGTRVGTGPVTVVVAEPGTIRVEVDAGGRRRERRIDFPRVRTTTFGSRAGRVRSSR